MTEAEQKFPKRHVLFLAFPAFGHLIPLLELAKKTSQFHQVTFVVSSSKVEELYKRELVSREEEQNSLRVVGLEDGVVTDFDTLTTPGLDRINRFVDGMQPALHTFLHRMPISGQSGRTGEKFSVTEPVDVVIAERFLASICLSVCYELGIPCCIFNASSGCNIGIGLDLTEETPAVPDNGTQSLSQAEMSESVKKFLLNVNGRIDLASAVIVNTFLKCDRRGVDSLAAHPKTKNIPVFCVGPIFPPEGKMKIGSNSISAQITAAVTKWLDQQKARSVVYVSFGSIASLSPVQTEIMGQALLSMGKPFIYSISESLQAVLPPGIRDQIHCQFEQEKSPFLVLSWAPQKAILQHSSVSVFVTHAGWNSTIESISGGVPMVAWPMFADQHANGNWIVEKGIELLVPGTKMVDSRLVALDEILEAFGEVEKCRENCEALAKEAEHTLREDGNSNRDFMKLMKFDFSARPTDELPDSGL